VDIQLIHITKSFGEKKVLQDVTITFPVGRISCLMGASGIGKTTLINLIMGIDQPDWGELLGCKNLRMAAVFQEDRLIEHWDAVKNIRLVCGKQVTKEQIEKHLQEVGLLEVQDKPVSSFSGGMRRRVVLVRAMLAKSELLIMDEPLKGLDNEMKLQVIEYIKRNMNGRTVIIVTHDKEEAESLNAQIITLNQRQ